MLSDNEGIRSEATDCRSLTFSQHTRTPPSLTARARHTRALLAAVHQVCAPHVQAALGDAVAPPAVRASSGSARDATGAPPAATRRAPPPPLAAAAPAPELPHLRPTSVRTSGVPATDDDGNLAAVLAALLSVLAILGALVTVAAALRRRRRVAAAKQATRDEELALLTADGHSLASGGDTGSVRSAGSSAGERTPLVEVGRQPDV